MIIVNLHVPPERISFYFQLLAFGFSHTVETGCSLKDVLCRQLGIDPAYLETRIQTIFVDGKTVDGVDGEIVRDGSVIALSSAMPGLVGAVFRKGGILKSFRSHITLKKSLKNQNVSFGTITLKLFNQVAADIGPVFLESGIRIKGDDFKWFFERNVKNIALFCNGMEIDGKKNEIRKKVAENWEGKDIQLTICSG